MTRFESEDGRSGSAGGFVVDEVVVEVGERLEASFVARAAVRALSRVRLNARASRKERRGGGAGRGGGTTVPFAGLLAVVDAAARSQGLGGDGPLIVVEVAERGGWLLHG